MSQNERKPRHWAVSLAGMIFAFGMFVYEVLLSLRSARPDGSADHGLVACTFLIFVILYAIHFRYRNDASGYRRLFERQDRLRSTDPALTKVPMEEIEEVVK